MTSRERVLTALSHREPDRVPIDIGGHRSSGMMAIAYIRLRKALGLPASPVYVYDLIQQLAIVEDDVQDLLGGDVTGLGCEYAGRPGYWKDWTLPDGSPCKIPAFIPVERTPDGWVVRGDAGQVIALQKDGTLYFEQEYFPYLNKESGDFADLDYQLIQVMWWRIGSPPAPAGLDDAGLAVRRADALALRAGTDRAIYAAFGGNLLESGTFAFRNDYFLYLLAAEPELVHRFLDSLMEYHLANLEKYLSAVGDCIDILGFGDDLGTQTGPIISPAMYVEFFKERHAQLWQRAKQLAPHAKIALHCCGGVYPLLPHLIEAGLEVINPVQFTCKDMEINRLKHEFGRDITFWGAGCDTRYILPSGTPDEVRRHVREQVATLAPDGGFVFQQVHNIMADVPAENILAMYEAVRG